MHNKFFKYILKSIKTDLSRLIAICLITFLGIGFLVGLMSSPKDLKSSINCYYEQSNLMDIYIQSTIGFNTNDIDFLKENIEGISDIEGYYQNDVYAYIDGTKIQARIIYKSFDENSIDKLELVDGNFPDKKNSCVMLSPKDSMVDSSLGSELTIDNEKFEIVGKVNDPFYLANQPEKTLIGSGTLDGVFYIDSKFNSIKDITTIKICFEDAKSYNTFTNEYTNYINNIADSINNFADDRIELRKETIKKELSKQIEDKMLQEIKNQVLEILPSLSESEVLNKILDSVKNSQMFQDSLKETTNEKFNELIKDLPLKWFVLTRNQIPSYVIAKADIEKINTVSNILPVFFFLIALLVSITSITRIVQKDRIYIGTLRSIGYSKNKIYVKYLIYGLLSSLIGCVIGAAIGTFILPLAIMQIYRTLYDIPQLIFEFDYASVLFFSSLMILMIVGAALLIVHSNLKENVSSLLVGKAPVAGKKILLEKIPFIWNHISFKQKSMLRNVFRFKKNLIMIVVGIGGCTGLLLTSFGLRDSIGAIQNKQYGQIINYDLIVNTKNVNENPIDDSIKNTSIYYFNGTVLDKDENIPISLISSDNLNDYIGFSGENMFNENSIIITKQIADEIGLSKGDMITIDLDNKDTFKQVRITGITDNYINNYVYMGESAYKNCFGAENKNAYIVKTNFSEEALKEYTRELLNNKNVTSVVSTNDMKVTYDNVLNNLTSIVIILVLLSGALIAVVIYNLTDIIVNERIKEIATLRVTGYTRRETLNYIFREVLFMSAIGILVGLALGVGLHQFVMSSITSLGLRFGMSIEPLSYLYTILLAFGFVILTAICFYPKIKNIQMAEALKSVE